MPLMSKRQNLPSVSKSVPSCTGGGGGGGGQEASIWRRIKIRAEVSYHGSFSETDEMQVALVTFSFPSRFHGMVIITVD